MKVKKIKVFLKALVKRIFKEATFTKYKTKQYKITIVQLNSFLIKGNVPLWNDVRKRKIYMV